MTRSFVHHPYWKALCFLAFACLLSVGGGCLNITPLAQCLQPSDCDVSKGEKCERGICRSTAPPNICQKPCKIDTDCPATCGMLCLNDQCTKPKWHSVSRKQSANKAVDILFVVDNSGSMKEEQEKLARNFKTFIEELTRRDIGNYQIGIISTDMISPLESGRLLAKPGLPKIISRAQLPAPKVIEAFKANINLGVRGTSYEKPLDAIRAALSPRLLNDPLANKGFLRPDSLLSIFIITDEDDCSHDGSISETELDSEVCRLPNTETLRDDLGNPIPDSKGNPIKGHMNNLTSTSTFITFLKSLNRPVHVGGLIGDPMVYKDATKKALIDPKGGCLEHGECADDSPNGRKCIFRTPAIRSCGGCLSKFPKFGRPDANAVPGFRLYDVIKAFGGDGAWFPICGDDAGFNNALLRTAQQLGNRLEYLIMSPAPLPNTSGRFKVEIIDVSGTSKPVLEASKGSRTCQNDAACQGGQICGPSGVCRGDGWVYFANRSSDPGTLPWIRLSGSAKSSLSAGATLKATYLIAP